VVDEVEVGFLISRDVASFVFGFVEDAFVVAFVSSAGIVAAAAVVSACSVVCSVPAAIDAVVVACGAAVVGLSASGIAALVVVAFLFGFVESEFMVDIAKLLSLVAACIVISFNSVVSVASDIAPCVVVVVDPAPIFVAAVTFGSVVTGFASGFADSVIVVLVVEDDFLVVVVEPSAMAADCVVISSDVIFSRTGAEIVVVVAAVVVAVILSVVVDFGFVEVFAVADFVPAVLVVKSPMRSSAVPTPSCVSSSPSNLITSSSFLEF